MANIAAVTQPQFSVLANDFRRQWEEIRGDALAAVERVGMSGWLILGAEVDAFERTLAQWWGVPHVVGVASGLDAIEIALRCRGLTPGDRVLTTPLTAFATTLAIIRAGGEPVWCDVDETGGLDLDQATAAITADPTIRFILPVHLYGHPLDPAALGRLASLTGVQVIEDCAQSAGARRDGRPTGLTGAVGATSFYPTKNIGAMGDGGAVITADAAVAERAKHLRDYGQSRRYVHDSLGLNSRLDELQAAILRSAILPRLTGWVARRREIAARYHAAFTAGDRPLRIVAPAGGESAHHLFPIELLSDDPDAAIARLREHGIAAARHYPFVCQDQAAARGHGYTFGDEAPVARRIARREVSLPIHPFLSDAEIDYVISVCGRVVSV